MKNNQLEQKDIGARKLLYEKLGINEDYISLDVDNDGVCDSFEFKYDDIKFLETLNISKEQFYKIFVEYQKEILNVIQRNNKLKIPTLLDDNGETNVFSDFEPNRILKTVEQFIDNSNSILRTDNKVFILELFNLIKTYPISYLLDDDKNKVIRKEIDSGIYDYIKSEKTIFTDEERKQLYGICDEWNKQDMGNYKNLKLLRKRFGDLLETEKISHKEQIESFIKETDNLISSSIPEKQEKISDLNIKSTKVMSDKMSELYLKFEELNRKNIIDNVLKCNGNILIRNEQDLDKIVLIHFYFPDFGPKMKNILQSLYRDTIINETREKYEQYTLTDEQIFEKYKEEFEIKVNDIDSEVDELSPGESVKLIKTKKLYERTDTLILAQNQLATYCSDLRHVLYTSQFRSKDCMTLAVGFDNSSILPENIILSCDKNALSNLGRDSIPYEDKFIEHSHTIKELVESDDIRNEVLLSRNENGNKIKAAYLFCLCERDLENDEGAKKIYEKYKSDAKSRGIGFVCVDKFHIDKQINKKLESKNENYHRE